MRTAPTTLVGRERELAELRTALDGARAGAGGFVLISGDAGIGKTSLVDELAGEAEATGVCVLRGRCWEAPGAPPYWPWTQVIRAYVRDRDVEGALVDRLAPILPELAEGSARPPSDGGEARFALFAAVAELVVAAAGDGGLMLLLDDVHAADRASLLLLEFLTRELPSSVLVVAAYRELEAERGVARASLGRLAATGMQLPLRGLTDDQVGSLISAVTGADPSVGVAESIRAATGGNPFLVRELARLLAAEGRLNEPAANLSRVTLPVGARQAVERRLSFISERAAGLLRRASVAGREFTTRLVEELEGVPRAEAASLLSEAGEVGLVRASADGSRWTLDHGLIHESLYASLHATERLGIHRRTGEALERIYAERLDPHAGELAHHFLAAEESDRGSDYARRAGAWARSRLAYEEAAVWFRRALDALTPDRADHDEIQLELLLALAEAQRRMGRTEARRATSLEAAAVARRLGRADALARAALLLGADTWASWVWQTDELVRAHLEEALDAIGAGDSALRVRLLGHLAQELQFGGQPARTAALTDEAVRMARRLGDPATLGAALAYRHAALLGVADASDRARVAAELIDLGESSGRLELALQGHVASVIDALEMGDIGMVDREIAAVARLSERLGLPTSRWQLTCWRAMRAIVDGRLDDAERLSREARELGEPAYGAIAAAVHLMQLIGVRWWQGAADDVLPSLEATVEQVGRVYSLSAVLAVLYAAVGRADHARRELERFAPEDFAQLPRHHSWPSAMMSFAWVAARVADSERSRALYRLLLPMKERYAVGGAAVTFLGPVAMALGMLAATLGEVERAVEHFEDALARNRRTGDVLYMASAEAEYAALLLTRRSPGDGERAAELLAHARETAERAGSGMLRERIAEVEASQAAPDHRCVFRREGDVWAVGRAGAIVRLRDAKGMRYIARLLSQPNVEMPAIELVSPGGASAHGADAENGADLLDAEAKAAYRARLDELEDEIDEARRFNDSERVARAEEELDFLRRELARAVGLGGRDRRTGTAGERARLNATRAIKDATARIAAEDEAVGAHLAATIRTGRACVYLPGADPPAWDLAD